MQHKNFSFCLLFQIFHLFFQIFCVLFFGGCDLLKAYELQSRKSGKYLLYTIGAEGSVCVNLENMSHYLPHLLGICTLYFRPILHEFLCKLSGQALVEVDTAYK